MKAFTDTVITKEEMVLELERHVVLDSFIKGRYGKQNKGDDVFKGCAVGCSLESIGRLKNIDLSYDEHKRYEDLMGIPEWLARVEDTIFEGLPLERSKLWPLEFTKAINVGADLDKIKAEFLVFVLRSTLEYVQDDKQKKQRDAIQGVIDLWLRDDVGSNEWESARKTARANAVVAYCTTATYAAAYSAFVAAAVAAATVAAATVAATVAAAAYATYATYAAGASAATKKAKYNIFADEILRLIRDCK